MRKKNSKLRETYNRMCLNTVKRDAVILAGGFGTRMASSFPNTPKSLIPVNGVPILEHIILECKKYGFDNILILVHHNKEQIINYFQDGTNWGVSLKYLFEEKPLGTGGALYQCVDLVGENFIILYADVYSDLNLKDLMNFHIKSGNQITCVSHPNDHPFDSDILQADVDGNLVKVCPHPHQEGLWLPNSVNAALYCGNKKAFSCMVPFEKFDIAQDYLNILITNGYNVGIYKTAEYIKDMGTQKRLKRVTNDIENKITTSRSKVTKKNAIFLDRDGTINREVGYVRSPESFCLNYGVEHAIARINSSKYLALCVTNQPVIARGELTVDGLVGIHNKMDTLLGRSGAYLDDILFCPHHPDRGFVGEVPELKISCMCRKPEMELLEKFSSKYNIDNSHSFMIGDRFSDILAGNKAGTMSILLDSGSENKQEHYAVRPFLILKDLVASVDFILEFFEHALTGAKQIVTLIQEDTKLIFLGGNCGLTRLAIASILERQLQNPLIVSSDFEGETSVSSCSQLRPINSLLEGLLSDELRSFNDTCYVDYLKKSYTFGEKKIPYRPLVICEGRYSFKYLPKANTVFPKMQSFYLEKLGSIEELAEHKATKIYQNNISTLYEKIITIKSNVGGQ